MTQVSSEPPSFIESRSRLAIMVVEGEVYRVAVCDIWGKEEAVWTGS